MGEPQPGDCLECGRPTRSHTPAEFTEHATTWLADPDRNPTDLLTFFHGLLIGYHDDLAKGAEHWLLQANLRYQLRTIAEAKRRRDRVAAAATRQEGTTP